MILRALIGVFRNFPQNKRFVYAEAPPESLYEERFFHLLYTPADKIGYLLKLSGPVQGLDVLDAGCGRGEMVFEFEKRGAKRSAGLDISPQGIEIARKTTAEQKRRAEFFQGSVCGLPFEDASFDCVFMTDLVEHLSEENLLKAFSEMRRVLRSNGVLVIHTQPTVNFKKYGQYFVKEYMSWKKLPWMLLTVQEESRYGHINIQSKSSLENYLKRVFEGGGIRVFYSPIHLDTVLKKIIHRLGLWRFLSPHLWAVVRK